MSDTLSVLTSKGPLLTKRWTATGILGYDKARNYTVENYDVDGIEHLSRVLKTLEEQPRRCVIRGQHLTYPDQHVATTRDLEHFEEQAHHWVCFDVDAFRPMLYDPVAEPAEAVDEFINCTLPDQFLGISHHWQLSSSAGRPGNENILKAHIWFWLDERRTGQELEAWARAIWADRDKPPVDITVFRTVQVHYTASPVIDPGIECPVRQRSGFIRGILGDEVSLVMPEMDELPRRTGGGRAGMVDPKAKPGLIGAFCRAYPPTRAVDELLGEHFEFEEGSGHRLTWLGGGGAPGGACITDDGQHVHNSHATDPFEGRAVNTWDLCRHHLFGHLDKGLTDFEQDDPSLWPSQRAMLDLARSLEDVQGERQAAAEEAIAQPVAVAVVDAAAERERGFQSALRAIEDCTTCELLETDLAPKLRGLGLHDFERERLARALQVRGKALSGGAQLPIATVRGWLRPDRLVGGSIGGPEWLADWVFVTDGDRYFNLRTKQSYSARGFDIVNSMQMPLSRDNIRREVPSDFASRIGNIQTVGGVCYAPGLAETFTMLGTDWGNTYREDSTPASEAGGEAAIALAQAHLQLLFPDDRERGLMLSWMAHNVRFPGKKIRWAPYIYGAQGTGKTYILELMACVMGSENVRSLSGSSLTSTFNGWCTGNAVVGIEEVYQSGHLFETEEKLKGPIANNSVDVHRKGKDSYAVPNFTNYLLLSNHPDGMPVGSGDRRFFFLRCAISSDDAVRMAADGYYDRLFDATWANIGGLRRWLAEEVVLCPEFDAEGRAPATGTREAVIQMSRSDADVAAEDILDGAQVVTTDWLANELRGRGHEVKSRQLTRLLQQSGFEFVKQLRINGIKKRVYALGTARSLHDDGLRAAFAVTVMTPLREFEGMQ